MAKFYKCVVCGWEGLEREPIFPFNSHEICACCGTEYGLDVREESDVAVVRREWLQDGAPWFDDEDDVEPRKPEKWDIDKAKAQVTKLLGS